MNGMHANFQADSWTCLACPQTKQRLSLISLDEARRILAGGQALHPRVQSGPTPFGETPMVLLREDAVCVYPIEDGIPVLLAPEMLTAEPRQDFDLRNPKYAEAYDEMEHYNRVGMLEAQDIRASDSFRIIAPALASAPNELVSFPNPKRLWIDAVYDCAAQWDAYDHIAPIQGKRILQLGGSGVHAVKFLLAGAREAWVLTPMIGEIRCAIALATAAHVVDRLRCVVAVAEELPFVEDAFDAVYSGGCVHHMDTTGVFAEIARVLRPGGKFAAADPWRAPFYAFGTWLFGKREAGVYCRPLDQIRVAPIHDVFNNARVVQHGTLTRYPLLALNKLGLSSNLPVAWFLNKADDAVCSVIPGLRRLGSSVALLGTK
jgi:uncharacterized protein YbaR (Trm112 family)/SAM-dependent methyltransferase